MKYMTTAEIRDRFLTYFQNNQHEIVPSSSLIPANDPTLLFTNAGMVQFKDIFLGSESRPYQRAATAQRCVRAGGKHNDLENVGYTARHHTFFEMLGNFSFGDYFKRDAIKYAWDFLTNELGLPAEKLWVTVYTDDDEAADIWLKEIGVDASRFSRCGEADNFWAMGDTGPCGPCSEIFYDHGEDIPGGPPGSVDADGDRYIEVWNLVFMQYNRSASGELTPLPKPSVDTGMGLERLAAIMQDKHNNYQIDLFENLLYAIEKIVKSENPDLDINQPQPLASMRVIADHIRSSAFLIADGVDPSNEGRGYVLRRIIRRGARHGHTLGIKREFLCDLIQPLVQEMGDAYPILTHENERISTCLRQEESQFLNALAVGLKVFNSEVATLTTKTIPGEVVFRLYDTYGFPADMTADVAREKGLQVDMAGFDQLMAKQRAQSQASSQFTEEYQAQVYLEAASTFTGYEHELNQANIIGLYHEGRAVDQLKQEQRGWIVLDKTPFYGESGGQIGDTGVLSAEQAVFIVQDTQKQSNALIHKGFVSQGELHVGMPITAEIDHARRQAIRLNHSATHLLHAALRQVLGKSVVQKGSLVAADRLRFDFSYPKALTSAQLSEVELLINQKIQENTPVQVEVMSMADAQKAGAMALFGEKYGERVRVLRMGGDFSVELCGGTHVERTGDIGLLKIVSEATVASGIRRIEALTGMAAVNWMREQSDLIDSLNILVKSHTEGLYEKVNQQLERIKTLEREREQLKARFATKARDELSEQTQIVDGVNILITQLKDADAQSLRNTVDQLKQKLGTAIIGLASVSRGKVVLVAGVTPDMTKRLSAGELVNEMARKVGGKGGGRPDFAQAGGPDVEQLPEALKTTLAWVREQLLQAHS